MMHPAGIVRHDFGTGVFQQQRTTARDDFCEARFLGNSFVGRRGENPQRWRVWVELLALQQFGGGAQFAYRCLGATNGDERYGRFRGQLIIPLLQLCGPKFQLSLNICWRNFALTLDIQLRTAIVCGRGRQRFFLFVR